MGEPGAVGRNLNRLIESTGIGATELARRSGVPRSTIISLRNGAATDAFVETAKRLAVVLGVTLDELAADEPPATEEGELACRLKASLAKLARLVDEFAKR
jgi:transcriptional regulator with XRE-family HTH domain